MNAVPIKDLLRHFADVACALNQIRRSADVITGEPASSLPDTAEDLAELLDCPGGWVDYTWSGPSGLPRKAMAQAVDVARWYTEAVTPRPAADPEPGSRAR